ncbi:hypothetical protein LTR84_011214 [Exophiala bonariae]|uniref:Uncharacterized protein n=1 Tax=Exophiala bonariae TaxID=1690606 RepID=A0AAV9NK47_9EURO|nr:hypothetical protein LTR84_011214 [Exophiala bonariae]
MADRTGRWGSEGQGSSRSRREEEERLERQAAARQSDRARRARDDETFTGSHKAVPVDHYSNYANSREELYQQNRHRTEEMKRNPSVKSYWPSQNAGAEETYLKQWNRADVYRSDHSNDEAGYAAHRRERLECSEGNAQVMEQSPAYGISVRDFAYPKEHSSSNNYRDPREALTPACGLSPDGYYSKYDTPSPEGKGKGKR